MHKIFKTVLALAQVALLGARVEAQTVPTPFLGINTNDDPTIYPVYPNFASIERVWNAAYNFQGHAAQWSMLNTSSGVYSWTTLDPILTFLANNHIGVNWTGGNVPTWVNSSQSLSGATQIGDYTAFVTALIAHVAANGKCFAQFEQWNEMVTGSGYWTGTYADAATLQETEYPVVKAGCPKTTVLSASALNNYPFWFNTLSAINSSGIKSFDALNVHGYVPSTIGGTNVYSTQYAPELEYDLLVGAYASATAAGFGALPMHVDEWYVGPSSATTSNANTVSWASAQAVAALLQASAGIVESDPFAYGVNYCAGNNQGCGNIYGSATQNGLPLNLTGLALRSVTNWLSGATFSSPLMRTLGSNQIRTAPNGSAVAVGALGGTTGAGCTGFPSGTGSLPTNWSLSASAAIAGGLSFAVVANGTSSGLPYIALMICGTDTNGAGPNVDNIYLETSNGISAAINSQENFRLCWNAPSGSLANITEFDVFWQEYDSSQTNTTYGENVNFAPFNAGLASQCYDARYQLTGSTTDYVRPAIFERHSTNVPVNITFNLASPSLDTSTQWTGAITKAGGYSAEIAWDASDGNSTITAPAGSVDYRDPWGGVYPTSGGATIQLNNGVPILIENQSAKYQRW